MKALVLHGSLEITDFVLIFHTEAAFSTHFFACRMLAPVCFMVVASRIAVF